MLRARHARLNSNRFCVPAPSLRPGIKRPDLYGDLGEPGGRALPCFLAPQKSGLSAVGIAASCPGNQAKRSAMAVRIFGDRYVSSAACPTPG
jgi:hypothetical protein